MGDYMPHLIEVTDDGSAPRVICPTVTEWCEGWQECVEPHPCACKDRALDKESGMATSPAGDERAVLYRPLIASAVNLGAMAACEHGQAQFYRATLESEGLAAVATLVRVAARMGGLDPLTADPETTPWVAHIDILDINGAIVQHYSVSTEAAWTWWKTAAEMRLTESDCPICDTAADDAMQLARAR